MSCFIRYWQASLLFAFILILSNLEKGKKFDSGYIQGSEFEISSKFLANSTLDYFPICEAEHCK